MKITRTAIMAAGIYLMLLSACTKSDSEMMSSSATGTGTQQQKDVSNNVTSLKFKGGSMLTSSLIIRQNGAILANMQGVRRWNLFEPIIQSGLPLNAGDYQNLSTTMHLAPGEDGSSLNLQGSMSMTNEAGVETTLPISFTITQPLNIMRTGSGDLKLTESTGLVDLMQLPLANLANNIPPEIWQHAIMQGKDVIVISDQENPELHYLMLGNFMSMFQAAPAAPDLSAEISYTPVSK